MGKLPDAVETVTPPLGSVIVLADGPDSTRLLDGSVVVITLPLGRVISLATALGPAVVSR